MGSDCNTYTNINPIIDYRLFLKRGCVSINVSEYRRGHQQWTIQRNWQINDREYRRVIKNGQSSETGQINVIEYRRAIQN
jgi:hypothetical protein